MRFKVKEVIFRVGQMVDPVTGRRCRGPYFVDEDMRKFQQVLPSDEEKTEKVKIHQRKQYGSQV